MLYDYAAKEPRRDLPVLGSKPRDLKLRNRDTYHRLIGDPRWQEKFIPALKGLPNRQIDRHLRIVQIRLDKTGPEAILGEGPWYLFDYDQQDPITGRAAVTAISGFSVD